MLNFLAQPSTRVTSRKDKADQSAKIIQLDERVREMREEMQQRLARGDSLRISESHKLVQSLSLMAQAGSVAVDGEKSSFRARREGALMLYTL